jgi:hypothetical protein
MDSSLSCEEVEVEEREEEGLVQQQPRLCLKQILSVVDEKKKKEEVEEEEKISLQQQQHQSRPGLKQCLSCEEEEETSPM